MELSTDYLASLFLVAVRVIAFLMVMPVLGHRAVPSVAKIGLGIALAVVVLPPGSETAAMTDSMGLFLLAVGREVLVGIVTGFAANLVFTGISMAGSLIGVQVGLGFESMGGVNWEERSSPFEQLYGMVAAMVFLAADGHHQVLMGLNKLFQVVPINSFSLNDLVVSRMVQMSSGMFMVALRLALPVMGALLLTDVALALMARVAFQMNIFFLGLPLKIVVGMMALSLALPFLVLQVERLMGGLAGDFSRLLAVR